jgi:hypothetical protein
MENGVLSPKTGEARRASCQITPRLRADWRREHLNGATVVSLLPVLTTFFPEKDTSMIIKLTPEIEQTLAEAACILGTTTEQLALDSL